MSWNSWFYFNPMSIQCTVMSCHDWLIDSYSVHIHMSSPYVIHHTMSCLVCLECPLFVIIPACPHVRVCSVTSIYMSCHGMVWYVMVWYVMVWYVMVLFHDFIPCHVMSWNSWFYSIPCPYNVMSWNSWFYSIPCHVAKFMILLNPMSIHTLSCPCVILSFHPMSIHTLSWLIDSYFIQCPFHIHIHIHHTIPCHVMSCHVCLECPLFVILPPCPCV